MADNEHDLLSWQVGTQSVFGTAVTPTAKLMGISSDSTLKPEIEISPVEEMRGTLTPSYDATVDKKNASAKISGDLNFEQIDYWLGSAFGVATPTGAGPYERVYSGPGAKPTPGILTLMHGGTEGVYKMTGSIVDELTISAESNKRLTYEAALIGKEIATGALATLNDTAVNYAHANQATLFIDAWAGTMGATALTATAFKLDLKTKLNRALKHGVGSLTPLDHYIQKLDSGGNQLALSLELTSQSKAWLDSLIGTSVLKLQVKALFTFAATQKLQIEFAGFASEAPEIFSDSDGVSQIELNLSAMYHSTLATWLKITTTNAVAVLP